MKKTLFSAVACLVIVTSCNNESIQTVAQENNTAEAVQNFKRAIITVNNSKDLPVTDGKLNSEYQSFQMSEQRKDILLPAAKHLIKSTGIKDEQIEKTTNGDKTTTILWAMEIFRNNYKNSSL
ncbi:hypothetical protein ODZ84_08535 [Chryseobacterium fluminis]|uniref:hypothetical protein n=1 Tax=Chryseobacterium fluminis TaxID=2983606 RepID=UPI00225735C6|nr:hypothetical protein [Chryseobacterium sp. MMS21-Ot14]UZT99594.1 hypothetical protein ODZ84_08535 [Chryseobacterium sp. MMS21-Ot14]